ncbi:hypothetical protein EVG20_g5331 [Dentipellis fragilis]|uniref:Uncharacterized protein n=1 Tax=Dentipellis fragilis TaxID=205917 RepID=A0A4Y9YVK9_9AGAM|nr:hypothetical protein EVG20_g5331 [Dentipellis fragilis]
MFSKSFFVSLFVVALSSQAYAHAAIAPALGVKGTPARSDVQRPATGKECGNVNVAQTLDTSTPIVANGNSFTATITNFNGGKDGSREVTNLQVDASGAGKTFVKGTVTTNGDAAPATTGSQQIVGSLPAGTKCTGGKSGNLCLVSLTTAGGFGNCVVVQQGAAGATGAAAAGAAAAPAASASTAAKPATNKAAAKGAKKGGKKGGKKAGKNAAKNANKQTAARSWASRRNVRLA